MREHPRFDPVWQRASDQGRDAMVADYWQALGITVPTEDVVKYLDRGANPTRSAYVVRDNIARGMSIGTFPAREPWEVQQEYRRFARTVAASAWKPEKRRQSA